MRDLLVKTKKFNSLSELFGLEPNLSIIAGPCSIESDEQMELIAQTLLKNNICFIRGGAYKPRTSPYDFQGLGYEGMQILNRLRKKYNLLTVTEVMDPRDIETGIEYTDIIQIGSRNMFNYSLLKEIGRTQHPVIIKRGMMSTIDEFLMAAEYVASEGNNNVIMCERGIRTFETYTRNTLDITCIAVIKQQTSLPVIVDISHALGRTDLIIPIVKYIMHMDIDGIMLEVHPNPSKSISDSRQTLSLEEFSNLVSTVLRS